MMNQDCKDLMADAEELSEGMYACKCGKTVLETDSDSQPVR